VEDTVTGTVDHVEALANALDQAHTVIDGIRPDQRTAPTPCRSWDVTALVNHLFLDLANFATSARGDEVDWSAPAPEVAPEDWSAAFAVGAKELVAEWRRAGVGPGLDMQISELALHAWDLDVATEQNVVLDPLLAEIGLHWMRGMLKDEYRGSEADGKSFGPEIEVDDDAPVYARLAAFSGREP
jgi:uncharacterized protein (TIGR03086 family)